MKVSRLLRRPKVEQLERILLAIEELPLALLPSKSYGGYKFGLVSLTTLVVSVVLTRSRQVEALVIPVNELVLVTADAVMCIRVVDEITVHPIAVHNGRAVAEGREVTEGRESAPNLF